MTQAKKVLVVGASGLVGSAVVSNLVRTATDFIAVSRNPPAGIAEDKFIPVDLLDAAQCQRIFGNLSDITHLVYCALFEQPSLVSGWSDQQQIKVNGQMFENVLDHLNQPASNLQHVALLQGTKAYGVHVRAIPIPAREDRDELHSQASFYWEQETHLRRLSSAATWHWTILRPTLIVGDTSGPMSALPAIGVFAAMRKHAGEPLGFPGGGPRIANACDVDLLARAIAWSGDNANARNEIFNVTNGDVYVWENLWPAIAKALEVPAGPPVHCSLLAYCTPRAALWDDIRRHHQLLSGDLASFAGQSLQYCDYLLRVGESNPGAATIVSTVKLQAAGFNDVVDTEKMMVKRITSLRRRQLLP